MSMNVFVFLKLGSAEIEVSGLLQTSTSESYPIVYKRNPSEKCYGGIKHPWKESAKLYLDWVKFSAREWDTQEAHDRIKRQRKIIGDAWRAADENGGSLEFYVS